MSKRKSYSKEFQNRNKKNNQKEAEFKPKPAYKTTLRNLKVLYEDNHIIDAWGVVSSMRSVDESSALKLEDKIS